MSSTDIASIVGRNIQTARKAQGLSQPQLAAKVGVTSPMAVSRWERGEHTPSTANVVELALVLKHEVAWFYTDHTLAEKAA